MRLEQLRNTSVTEGGGDECVCEAGCAQICKRIGRNYRRIARGMSVVVAHTTSLNASSGQQGSAWVACITTVQPEVSQS